MGSSAGKQACGDGIVAGKLVGHGGDVVQGHRVALGGDRVAVGVGHGEHAVFIAPGALLVDAVGRKVKGEGAVGVEGQNRCAVVRGDLGAGGRGGAGLFQLGHRDGVVAGKLVGHGGDVVQSHGVALGGDCVAVGVGHGEHAVFVAPGSGLFNAVGLKEEGEGAVGVEGQGGGAVVRRDGDRLALGGLAAEHGSKIRRGDGVVAGELIGGGGHVVQVHRIAVGSEVADT